MGVCKRCNKRLEYGPGWEHSGHNLPRTPYPGVCSCFEDPRYVRACERIDQEEQRLKPLKEAAESKAQAEEQQELRKYCVDSLCMACELCSWTSATASAAATRWARSYKAVRELPMEERQSRVGAYTKEEREYLVWQRRQDGGKLPWMTSSVRVKIRHAIGRIGCTLEQLIAHTNSTTVKLIEKGESPAKAAPFIDGKPRAPKFCRSKRPPPREKNRRRCWPMMAARPEGWQYKYTRGDFKKATRPAASVAARVQKHRDLKGRSACDICGRLDNTTRDRKRCRMQRAD